MSPARKRRFTPAQRFAVYAVHGERCYLCTRSISLAEMEVDHLLPESLLASSERLAATLSLFGLSASFDLNSFDNWLPACRPCNNAKKATVFEPSPIVQLQLQRAAGGASKARRLADKIVLEREISRALSTLERAGQQGSLSDDTLSGLQSLLQTVEPFRARDRAVHPLRVQPDASIRHRIIEVSPDQKSALCLGSDNKLYRVNLDGMIPDLTDRGTQEGIFQLIREHLLVEAVWDHFDDGSWHVLCSLAGSVDVVELARNPTRWRAIIYAFTRLPVNREAEGLSVSERPGSIGLTLSAQPDLTYWFCSDSEGRYTPLGPEKCE